jgi:hypothetical protein
VERTRLLGRGLKVNGGSYMGTGLDVVSNVTSKNKGIVGCPRRV